MSWGDLTPTTNGLNITSVKISSDLIRQNPLDCRPHQVNIGHCLVLICQVIDRLPAP